jgi:hypothetical protein
MIFVKAGLRARVFGGIALVFMLDLDRRALHRFQSRWRSRYC